MNSGWGVAGKLGVVPRPVARETTGVGDVDSGTGSSAGSRSHPRERDAVRQLLEQAAAPETA